MLFAMLSLLYRMNEAPEMADYGYRLDPFNPEDILNNASIINKDVSFQRCWGVANSLSGI